MTPDQRTRWETRLRSLRQELVAAGDVSLGSEIDPSRKPDEDVAPHAEMEQVIASNRNRTHAQQLAEIDLALQRLTDDPDFFGLCEDCEDPISPRRMQLSPWVRRCIECQEMHDREGAPGQTRRRITDYR